MHHCSMLHYSLLPAFMTPVSLMPQSSSPNLLQRQEAVPLVVLWDLKELEKNITGKEVSGK